VVLMDVLMDEVSGIEACRQIKSALPETRVLMLTSHGAAQAVEASVLAGASGYLLKNGGRDDLLKGIRAVAHGESLLSPSITAQVLGRFADLSRKERERENDVLSEREKEVLVLVAQGMTNRQIAAELVISENTVRNHLSHILDKLDMSRRSQVAAYAARHGLLGQQGDADLG
jgi:DNA-binding NarL/FixJ family response regulator